MVVFLGMYGLRNERSFVNAALFEESWELNRRPAMKDVMAMMQRARKMEMYFRSFDL